MEDKNNIIKLPLPSIILILDIALIGTKIGSRTRVRVTMSSVMCISMTTRVGIMRRRSRIG